MLIRKWLLGLLIVSSLVSSAMSSAMGQAYQQQGARRGAVAGAVVGGIVGARNDRPALGIVVGGVAGALIGKAVGSQRDAELYQQQYGYGHQGYYQYRHANSHPQTYSQPYPQTVVQPYPQAIPQSYSQPFPRTYGSNVNGAVQGQTYYSQTVGQPPSYSHGPSVKVHRPGEVPTGPPISYVPPLTQRHLAPTMQYDGPFIPPNQVIIEAPQPQIYSPPYQPLINMAGNEIWPWPCLIFDELEKDENSENWKSKLGIKG